MSSIPADFDKFTFSKQPDFDEKAVRQAFAQAVPLRTVVVYCYDPRATGIPAAVADELGDVFPGQVITDEAGNKIASTTTVFPVVVAGGRAFDALRSVTVAQHLFGIENVVIVHHTHCGATTFTESGIVEAFHTEHNADISKLYPSESICISDYRNSLEHDVALMRASSGTAPHLNIYGYLYDIDDETLIKVCDNLAA